MARKQKSTGTIEEPITTSREPALGNGRMGEGGSRSEEEERLEDAEIAARAYQIYEREGRTDGKDLEHWLQAQAELRSERQGRSAQPGSQASQATAPRSARLQQESQDGPGRPTAAESGLQSGMSGSR